MADGSVMPDSSGDLLPLLSPHDAAAAPITALVFDVTAGIGLCRLFSGAGSTDNIVFPNYGATEKAGDSF